MSVDTVPGTLVTLDPSVNSSGVAIYVNGLLQRIFRVLVPSKGVTLDVKAALMAGAILDELDHDMVVNRFVYEWPQWYKDSPVDPNTLAGMAAVCGGVATDMLYRGAEICRYLPREWTQVSKSTRHKDRLDSPRAVRIISRLTTEETKVFFQATSHDEVDAIGIGLHDLGRLTTRRVFPGALPD